MANEIYDAITTLITAGGYDLDDVLHRIEVLYASGQLSDEERTQAQQLARDNSKPVFDVQTSLSDLTVRVQGLEDKVAVLEGSPVDEYPEYEDGYVYKTGDQITWSGKHYRMKLDGETTASPSLYPDAWELVEE